MRVSRTLNFHTLSNLRGSRSRLDPRAESFNATRVRVQRVFSVLCLLNVIVSKRVLLRETKVSTLP
jgi:hypothetical protein